MTPRRYHLVQETKKGSFVWLDSRSNQPLKTVTRWVCEDTGTLLMPSQMKFAFLYGGVGISSFFCTSFNMICGVEFSMWTMLSFF